FPPHPKSSRTKRPLTRGASAGSPGLAGACGLGFHTFPGGWPLALSARRATIRPSSAFREKRAILPRAQGVISKQLRVETVICIQPGHQNLRPSGGEFGGQPQIIVGWIVPRCRVLMDSYPNATSCGSSICTDAVEAGLMAETDPSLFVRLLLQHQNDLLRHILPLVGCLDDAQD